MTISWPKKKVHSGIDKFVLFWQSLAHLHAAWGLVAWLMRLVGEESVLSVLKVTRSERM